ncbi:MAG: HEAT repeat domain-containing protein [Minicystis sp.]
MRAAEVAGKVPAVAGDLVVAIEDGEVRVREAAINALAEVQAAGAPAPKGLADALEKRLALDEWTFVRAGAARTLGALPAEAGVDRALAAALKDPSPDVRGRALDALGEHRASAYADLARDLQAKSEETPEVRAHAVLALAAMCDKNSLGYWTKVAQRAKSPLDEADRRIGSRGDRGPRRAAPRRSRGEARPAPLEGHAAARARDGAGGARGPRSMPVVEDCLRGAYGQQATSPQLDCPFGQS